MNTTMEKLEFNEMSRIEGGWNAYQCLMAPINLIASSALGLMTSYYVAMNLWCRDN